MFGLRAELSEGEVRHPPRPSPRSLSLGRNVHMGDLLEVVSQRSGGPPPPSEHSHPFIDVGSFFFLSSVRAEKAGFSPSEPLPVFPPLGTHQTYLPSLRLLLLTNDFISLAVPQRCRVLNIMGGDSFNTFICNCAHCAC